MERIFVALKIPASAYAQLQPLRTMLDGARWTHEADYHITLQFIGEVQVEQSHQLVHELETIEFTQFELRPKGIGVFGPLERPKALYVGIEENSYLNELHELVVQKVKLLGLVPKQERSRFIPHISLARFSADGLPDIGSYMQAHSLFHGQRMIIEEFSLFLSRGRDESMGPKYQILSRFELY